MRGRRKTSPEDRGSLKSVSPGALMGFIPCGDMSGACSGSVFHLDPLMKPWQHWAQKSPGGDSNSDTVLLQRKKRMKLSP